MEVKDGKCQKLKNNISLARFDSGADAHVVRESKFLKNFKKFEEPTYCELADGKDGKLEGIGELDIYVTDVEGKTTKWMLKDVIVMPNYTTYGEDLLIATDRLVDELSDMESYGMMKPQGDDRITLIVGKRQFSLENMNGSRHYLKLRNKQKINVVNYQDQPRLNDSKGLQDEITGLVDINIRAEEPVNRSVTTDPKLSGEPKEGMEFNLPPRASNSRLINDTRMEDNMPLKACNSHNDDTRMEDNMQSRACNSHEDDIRLEENTTQIASNYHENDTNVEYEKSTPSEGDDRTDDDEWMEIEDVSNNALGEDSTRESEEDSEREDHDDDHKWKKTENREHEEIEKELCMDIRNRCIMANAIEHGHMHVICGHPSESKLQAILNSLKLGHLNATKLTPNECSVCELSSRQKEYRNRKGLSISTENVPVGRDFGFDVISMDTSKRNYKYIAIMIDLKSNFTYLVPTMKKTKTDLGLALREMMVDVVATHGDIRGRNILTDNDPAYGVKLVQPNAKSTEIGLGKVVSPNDSNKNSFGNVCKEYGIRISQTNNYESTQNSQCERRIKVFRKILRSVLLESGFNRSDWEEITRYAINVLINIWTVGKKNITPFEEYYGNCPPVDKLYSIGSRVFCLKENLLDKNGYQRKLGIFLGWTVVNPGGGRPVNLKVVVINERGDIMESRNIRVHQGRRPLLENEQKVQRRKINKIIYPSIPCDIQGKPGTLTLSDIMGKNLDVYLQDRKEWKEDYKTPSSITKALECPIYGDLWRAAVSKELKQMIESGTLVETDVLEATTAEINPMRMKWVFTVKTGEKPIRFKARLVALGFMQDIHTIGETYAPTIIGRNINIVLALALHYGLDIKTIDIEGAFLNATLPSAQYAYSIPGLETANGRIYRIEKSIYGLKEAPRLFSKLLGECLRDQDLEQSQYDKCLWYDPKRKGRQKVLIAVHVDDLLVTAPEGYAEELVTKLKEHKHGLKAKLSLLDTFLGRSYMWDKGKEEINISMERYIENMVKKFNPNSYGTTLPYSPSVKLKKVEDDKQIDPKEFNLREVVGRSIFLSATRYDIKYAVNRLSRHLNSYGEEHRKEAEKLVKYLYRTKSLSMSIRKSDLKNLKLRIECDSSWNGELDNNRRSTSGWILFLDNIVIDTECRTDKAVSKSTAEAELRAISAATTEVIYVRKLLKDIGVELSGDTELYNDSETALTTVLKEGSDTNFSRNVGVAVAYVQEAIANNEVSYHYINTKDNRADILTKMVTRKGFGTVTRKLPGFEEAIPSFQ